MTSADTESEHCGPPASRRLSACTARVRSCLSSCMTRAVNSLARLLRRTHAMVRPHATNLLLTHRLQWSRATNTYPNSSLCEETVPHQNRSSSSSAILCSASRCLVSTVWRRGSRSAWLFYRKPKRHQLATSLRLRPPMCLLATMPPDSLQTNICQGLQQTLQT